MVSDVLNKLTEFEIVVDDLNGRRDKAKEKLDTYQSLIRQAKSGLGRIDLDLLATMRRLDTEAG